MNPHTPTDVELWRRACDGDERAFGALFDRHARTVYNYCFRRTASWSEAEDLTSVVFLETWRRRAHVSMPSESLLPWLYGVATNVLQNHRRSLRRHREALSRLPAPEPQPDGAEEASERLDAERRMRRVMASIERLSRRDREVLVLCVWEGLGYAEAAEALGVPVGTVRSRLARARSRLRGISADPEPEPDLDEASPVGRLAEGPQEPWPDRVQGPLPGRLPEPGPVAGHRKGERPTPFVSEESS
ncbi:MULTISPECIES: RNA polymerase sigma factor [Actinomadura]|uniref:RNA polymerase sigma factor n=1 Tax=Actinomadura yumaensis TaxID=111807 RepID=A0ABW2CRP7_9ACTN|nr:RNA polymerase sigma factor [Actinomadura sp. J1-007]MWK39785.1 sigma-70 family RNA polymerase sigma factor [Actinomadura sp. J1-007]